jgi:hypothetical protein
LLSFVAYVVAPEDALDANTVTAVCATGIAVVSLVVSIAEARASRRHNRHSVRPILEFGFERQVKGVTGIVLRNQGVGPAVITATSLYLDGQYLGHWEEPVVNPFRDSLTTRPHARTFYVGKVVPPGYEQFILQLPHYERDEDLWFWDLIRRRLRIEITYDSLYGGEGHRVVSDLPYDGRESRLLSGRAGDRPTTAAEADPVRFAVPEEG